MKAFWKDLKECLYIFWIFFKVGFITFGGGLAVFKIYEDEFVNKKKLIDRDELYDYYVLSQTIPGIIIVSTSAFIGYKLKKQRGLFWAVAGVIVPSIVIITLVAMFMEQFIKYALVQKILKGMTVGVTAGLIYVTYDLIKSYIKNWIYALLAIASFVAVEVFNVHILIIVAIAATVGFFVKVKEVKKAVGGDEKC